MAYVTGYEHDIFISYAQVDNLPTNRGGKEIRWVSFFKEELQKRVDQKLGRVNATKIWMDPQDLGGNHAVTPTVDTAIRKTAVWVVVLSYGYLRSMCCQEDIRSFVEAANGEGRLFVVNLADIPRDDRPEGIRDFIGFNFFDPITRSEVDPGSLEFGQSLLRLRDELAERLETMARIKSSST